MTTLDLSPAEVRTIRVALAYWQEHWRHAPATDREVQAELKRITEILARMPAPSAGVQTA